MTAGPKLPHPRAYQFLAHLSIAQDELLWSPSGRCPSYVVCGLFTFSNISSETIGPIPTKLYEKHQWTWGMNCCSKFLARVIPLAGGQFYLHD